MEKLHPGAKWLFRIGGYFGAFFLMMFLGWILFPIIGFLGVLMFGSDAVLSVVLIGFVVYVILIIIFAEIYARMAYDRWFYEFTSTNLKIERGIIWKKYSNVPYERVQNVDIHRGVIARMCGFSTVAIQTAGFSYSSRGRGAGAEGSIPAVSIEKAEKIRDFLMKKIGSKHEGGQGL
ncbi:MAG: PH domain-containing protein [archaeon]